MHFFHLTLADVACARHKLPCNGSYCVGTGADAVGVAQVLALPPQDSWPPAEDEAGGPAGAGGLAAWGSRQLNLRRLRRCSWTEDLETCAPPLSHTHTHTTPPDPIAAPAALLAKLALVLYLSTKVPKPFPSAGLKACEGGVLSENV